MNRAIDTGAQETAPLAVSAERELKRARNTAYRYLTLRSRSRAEVEQKLHDRGYPAAVIGSVIEHLLRLGYLDDAQFARQWAASRVRSRGFGRRRIEQELKQKGIGQDIIHETVCGLFEESSELDVARREASKKLRTLSRFDPEARKRRLAGFLERKGFPSTVIWTIVREHA